MADRFRLLVESVLDYGIFMLDLDGHVTSWNPGAERATGYAAETIMGQHFSRFYRPEDTTASEPLRHLQRARVEDQLKNQGWRLRKDGSRFWADVTISRIRNKRGELVGFAHVLRDLREKTGDKVHEQLLLLKGKNRGGESEPGEG